MRPGNLGATPSTSAYSITRRVTDGEGAAPGQRSRRANRAPASLAEGAVQVSSRATALYRMRVRRSTSVALSHRTSSERADGRWRRSCFR